MMLQTIVDVAKPYLIGVSVSILLMVGFGIYISAELGGNWDEPTWAGAMVFAVLLGIIGQAAVTKLTVLLKAEKDAPTEIEAPAPDDGPVAVQLLWCYSNPRNTERLDLGGELKAVKRILEHSALELTAVDEATMADLLHEMDLLEPAVVHFSGHASESGLVFRHEEFPDDYEEYSPELLLRIFEGRSYLKCLVLNACESIRTAETLAGLGLTVIGTLKPLDDDLGIRFTRNFYRSLASGLTLEKALGSATDTTRTDPDEELYRAFGPLDYAPAQAHAGTVQVNG